MLKLTIPAKIDLALPATTEMKTNPIFISLLILALCVGTSLRPCVCPEELSKTIAAVATINHAGDLCTDCGHTKTCCFTHKTLPIVGSSASAASLDADLATGILQYARCVEVCRWSSVRIGSMGNRAPPWTVKPTLFEMHQQLLI
ncbi:MAG TPA: hypothetical protein V6C97_26625 [Oculatellaceae cyanobacterium]